RRDRRRGRTRRESRSCSSSRTAAAGISCRSVAAWRRSRAPTRLAAPAVPTRCRRRSPRVTRARTAEETDWRRLGSLDGELREIAPSPVVELNRAVAVSMVDGPAAGLALVDALMQEPKLKGYHLLPSVRADLLAKLGRFDEARGEFERAASLTRNARLRQRLLERAEKCRD